MLGLGLNYCYVRVRVRLWAYLAGGIHLWIGW